MMKLETHDPVLDRALRAEARVAELEDELAAWRDRELRTERAEAETTAEAVIANTLRRLYPRVQHAPQIARLLQLLIARPGHVFGQEHIVRAISRRGGLDLGSLKVVDVTVCHARKALRVVGLDHAIVTVWGKGYLLRADEAEAVAATLGLSA